jgi:hypothetical protein
LQEEFENEQESFYIEGLLFVFKMAERAGFEPARVLALHVFKTCPFNRSGISP